MLNLTLPLLLLVGAPFEDVHKRFSIDLPDHWKFTPIPGDTGSAAFQAVKNGLPAAMAVRVLPIPSGMTPTAFADRQQSAVASEPGFQELLREATFAGVLPAERRRYVVYVAGDPRRPKMADALYAVDGLRGYVLHAETVASAFGTFDAEFQRIFATFTPLRKKRPKAPVSRATAQLAGAYIMATDNKTRLTLGADGSLDFDGAQGTFQIEGAAFFMQITGGPRERLTWHRSPHYLTINAPGWDEPIRYYLAGTGPAILGKWTADKRIVHFSPSGVVQLETHGGTFTADSGVVTVALHDGRRITLRFKVDAEGRLTLSGGRYGAGVVFTRTR